MNSLDFELGEFLKALPVLVMHLDREGICQGFHVENPDDLPLPPEQMIGSRIRDLANPDLREPTLATFMRVVETGQPERFEYQVQTTRSVQYYACHLRRYRDHEVLAWIRNITDQKRQTVAELRKSEEKYRTLVETTPDLLYRTNLQGEITYISGAVERLSGYTVEEALGMKMAEEVYVRPEARMELLQRLQQDGEVSDFVNPLKRKDGSIWHGSANVRLDKDEAGNVVGVSGVVRDVTRRVEIENELSAYREHLEELIEERTQELVANRKRFADFAEVGSDWLWEADENHRFTWFSERMGEVLKADPGKLIGTSPFDLPHPEESRLSEKWAEMRAVVDERRSFRSFEYRMQTSLTDNPWRSISGKPVYAEDGTFRGYRGMGHDITERKQLEAQVIQSAKLASIGEVAAGVAHEVNTPLATIILSMFNVREALKQNNPELVESILSMVEQQTETVAGVIRELLSFSRNAQHDEQEVVDLNGVIETVFGLQARRLEQNQISLQQQKSPKPALVLGQKVPLEQICYNLLQNAMHAVFNQPVQTISLQAYVRGQRVLLEVRDSGIGIPKSQQQQVFEPFFTTKQRHLGTGLGLSISLRIARQYGGELRLQSKPGQGATFTLDLPLYAES